MKPEKFDQLAKEIIQELPEKFDSHDFIKAFLDKHEHEYVMWLSDYKDCKTGIFRTLHAQIALRLSKRAKTLNITKKGGKGVSENIKNYLSENQKWEKI